MSEGYRWGDPNNPRVENQEPEDMTGLAQQAGENCGAEPWSFKLEGGPRDGLSGTMVIPTKTMRVPEGSYRREALTDGASHEVVYRWEAQPNVG